VTGRSIYFGLRKESCAELTRVLQCVILHCSVLRCDAVEIWILLWLVTDQSQVKIEIFVILLCHCGCNKLLPNFCRISTRHDLCTLHRESAQICVREAVIEKRIQRKREREQEESKKEQEQQWEWVFVCVCLHAYVECLVCYSVLQCGVAWCSVLQCITVCYSVLHMGAFLALQFVAVCWKKKHPSSHWLVCHL